MCLVVFFIIEYRCRWKRGAREVAVIMLYHYIIMFHSNGGISTKECDGDVFLAIKHFNEIEIFILDTL